MGMDVSGVNPTAKAGKYFHRNCWGWRPLWDCAFHLAPEIIGDRVHDAGHYNDGAGLDREGSTRLADVLRDCLADGSARRYVEQRQAALRALPDEVCDLCHGTGKRTDMVVANGCNKCHGDGRVRPVETDYTLDVEDIEEFAAFLENCGGFEIN